MNVEFVFNLTHLSKNQRERRCSMFVSLQRMKCMNLNRFHCLIAIGFHFTDASALSWSATPSESFHFKQLASACSRLCLPSDWEFGRCHVQSVAFLPAKRHRRYLLSREWNIHYPFTRSDLKKGRKKRIIGSKTGTVFLHCAEFTVNRLQRPWNRQILRNINVL